MLRDKKTLCAPWIKGRVKKIPPLHHNPPSRNFLYNICIMNFQKPGGITKNNSNPGDLGWQRQAIRWVK